MPEFVIDLSSTALETALKEESKTNEKFIRKSTAQLRKLLDECSRKPATEKLLRITEQIPEEIRKIKRDRKFPAADTLKVRWFHLLDSYMAKAKQEAADLRKTCQQESKKVVSSKEETAAVGALGKKRISVESLSWAALEKYLRDEQKKKVVQAKLKTLKSHLETYDKLVRTAKSDETYTAIVQQLEQIKQEARKIKGDSGFPKAAELTHDWFRCDESVPGPGKENVPRRRKKRSQRFAPNSIRRRSRSRLKQGGPRRLRGGGAQRGETLRYSPGHPSRRC